MAKEENQDLPIYKGNAKCCSDCKHLFSDGDEILVSKNGKVICSGKRSKKCGVDHKSQKFRKERYYSKSFKEAFKGR